MAVVCGMTENKDSCSVESSFSRIPKSETNLWVILDRTGILPFPFVRPGC